MSDADLKDYIRDLDDRIVRRGGRSIFGPTLRRTDDFLASGAAFETNDDGRKVAKHGVQVVPRTGVPATDLRYFPRKRT